MQTNSTSLGSASSSMPSHEFEHRWQNSLEQGWADMCTIATSSCNYTKNRKILF